MILDLEIRFKDEAGVSYIWRQGTHIKVLNKNKTESYIAIDMPEKELQVDIEVIRNTLNKFIK